MHGIAKFRITIAKYIFGNNIYHCSGLIMITLIGSTILLYYNYVNNNDVLMFTMENLHEHNYSTSTYYIHVHNYTVTLTSRNIYIAQEL